MSRVPGARAPGSARHPAGRGVKYFIRETCGSSLEMAAQFLEALGEPASRPHFVARIQPSSSVSSLSLSRFTSFAAIGTVPQLPGPPLRTRCDR